MVKYVYRFHEGNRDQKDLLGGKGANLAEMTNLGLPVPPGFTITTEACRAYLDLGSVPEEMGVQVTMALRGVEQEVGKRLGDDSDPLLVSVRSGAKFSMPGMMETVLNVGLNDVSVRGLARMAGNDRFAWDSYRRLVQMFGRTVLGIDGDLFADALDAKKEAAGVTADTDLTAQHLEALVEEFKGIVERETGDPFPQDPRKQLDLAVRAVFDSWNTDRARIYRRRERIPHDLGTAVNVCTMVFGNLGETSGTGVAFTRDPSTGHSGVYGDYLVNAQGEDVVAGIRNTLSLADMEKVDAKSHAELVDIMHTLETHYRDLCDIEFTVQQGKLWMLQTRVGKRTAAAAFRVATQLVDEQLVTQDEALDRVTGDQLTQLLFPQFDAKAETTLLAKGMAASPGAAVGRIAFNNAEAESLAAQGIDCILVRRETNPDDLAGMVAARGVLTARGGKTSHAAVVARGMGKCCVVGAEKLQIDGKAGTLRVEGHDAVLTTDDVIAIDGSSGEIFLGDVPVVDSPVMTYIAEGLDAGLAASPDDDTKELVTSVHRLLTHADQIRRLKVRANADTPDDAVRSRERGAQGIGLCRTEHMFLGDRRPLVERLILADTDDEREAALRELEYLQRSDFLEIFEAMDGLPVTVRLIDPPLHEFLPDLTELSVKVALAAERGQVDEADEKMLEAVTRMHEQNPMLGMRGVRLALVIPGLALMQVRAITDAYVSLKKQGKNPKPEIMVPLIGSVRELQIIKDQAQAYFTFVRSTTPVAVDIPVGCMIELPRAALTAARIAEEADFFSFGTNDLTQTTWGFSRDDVESEFFEQYVEAGVFGLSPFESLDQSGVGSLVRMGVEGGRSTKPDLKTGVCGEHGGDPLSIHFFHDAQLDYVSCSPFRVPVARLEAGRAAVSSKGEGTA